MPLSTRHLSALNEVKPALDSLGYKLIAITPDSFTNLDSSMVRGGDLEYELLSDTQAEAIQAFGIDWKVDDKLYNKYKEKYNLDLEWWSSSKTHILPVPAVFIIENGKITFQYVNPDYSQRLSPEVLLALLRQH